MAVAALLAPSPASACPVCGQGADGSQGAYLFMSGVLSALPLLIVAGIVAWVVAHARAAAREPPAGADDGPPPDGERAKARPST